MKKIALLIISVFSIVVLCSCFPTGDVEKSDIKSDISIAELEHSEKEKLSFEFAIPKDYPETCKVVTAKRKIWNEKVIEDLFKSELSGEIEDFTEKDSAYYPGECSFRSYLAKDGSILAYDAGMIMYLGKNYEKYKYNLFPSYYRMYYTESAMREHFNKEAIPSFTVEEAENQMTELLKKLSVKTDGIFEVYAIDEETATAFDETLKWDKSADAYMVFFKQKIDGIELPVFDSYLEEISTIDTSTYICGVFSKNGMECFECYGCLEKVEEKDTVNICAPQEAALTVKEHVMSILPDKLNDRTEVSGCNLYYINTSDQINEKYFTLEPVWFFSQSVEVTNNEENSIKYYSGLLIDADNNSIIG